MSERDNSTPSPVSHVMVTDDWFSQVVSFLVKHDMLDARDEYDISDVMAALADNYDPASAEHVVGWEAEEKLTVEEAWTILCETPDVTSPEEYPDHALITMEQLGSFMARAAPVLQVKVKPLEWMHYDSGDACARSVITAYFAHIDGTWCVRNGPRIQAGTTLDEAKAAAQAHYDEQIRAALATATSEKQP